jgi:hypothetical protein
VTRDEAVKVAKVLATADGHCSSCADNLAERMEDVFPGHPWLELVADADA